MMMRRRSTIERDPHVRALSLTVYATDDARRYQVPGGSAIYDLFVLDGQISCTCKSRIIRRDVRP